MPTVPPRFPPLPPVRRRRLALAAVVAAIVATEALPARAQVLCSEPLTPLCLRDGREVGWTRANWQRCRQDVERHMADMRAYAACLEQKQQQAATALDSLENLVECAGETAEGCIGRTLSPEQKSAVGVGE